MFCRMFCKPRVHNGIYSIHCKRCFRNMGSKHSFIPRGFGLKLLYKGMIPTWFRRAMFLFLSCFVSCFEGLIFLQFQKICFYTFLSCFLSRSIHASYRFLTCFLGFLSMFFFMFLSCFSKIHFSALYNKFLQFFLLCCQ